MLDNWKPVIDEFRSINQSRSDYQLERFVVGQQDTPEMQYYQVLLEMKSMFFAISRMLIIIEKNELQIQELRSFNSDVADCEAKLLELSNDETRIDLEGMLREWNALDRIRLSFTKQFSRKDIEANQTSYWEKRLLRQAEFEVLGSGSLSFSQLDAMKQTGKFDKLISDVVRTQQQVGSFRGELLS